MEWGEQGELSEEEEEEREQGEGRAKVFEGAECISSFCHAKDQAWEGGKGTTGKVRWVRLDLLLLPAHFLTGSLYKHLLAVGSLIYLQQQQTMNLTQVEIICNHTNYSFWGDCTFSAGHICMCPCS